MLSQEFLLRNKEVQIDMITIAMIMKHKRNSPQDSLLRTGKLKIHETLQVTSSAGVHRLLSRS